MTKQKTMNDDEEDDEEDDDDGINETGAHDPPLVGAPPPGNLAQQPNNPPGEIPGVEAPDEAEEHGVAMDPEIPGVGEEEAEPEIPGVGKKKRRKQMMTIQHKTRLRSSSFQHHPKWKAMQVRYNLRGGQNWNYDHHYAGEDFIVDNDVGIAMTTKGCSEILETPQMSLKAGLQAFGDDGIKAVEKEMHQLHDHNMMTPVHKQCLTPEQ